MSELPQGWAFAPIGSICNLNNGRAFKPSDWSNTGLPIVRIQNLNNKHATFNFYNGLLESKYHLRGGELLFAWSGTPGTSFGAHVWQGGEAVLNQHIFRVDFDDSKIDKRFFRFAINQKLSDLINIAHGGVGLRHVTKGKFENTQIAIPPLNEQKRIADKLDALLKRVDACRERLDRVPLILKRFRQAVLAAATSGALTEDWRINNEINSGQAIHELEEQIIRRRNCAKRKFKEPVDADLTYWNTELPETWTIASVSAFAECLDHLRIPVKREARNSVIGSYPYYGANGPVDMVDEFLFDDELVLVTEDETFYGREKPIAYRVSGKCWVNNHAHVLRTESKISADYLCYCLMYYNVLPWLTGTTGRAKLTQAVLNSLAIAVPPHEEIIEIVRRVEKLFAFADKLEARYNAARKQVEQLTPALLAKAFRGELVDQDPNDEPAAVLLERIRAERIGQETKQRRDIAMRPSRKIHKPESAPLPLAAELAPAYGDSIPRRILAAMKNGAEYSRADLLAAAGISETEWLWAIRRLKAEGLVIQEGERRGARYRKA